jgi:hypothetical protein
MSTTSIAVERNKISEHVAAEKSRVVKVSQEPAKRTKFSFFMSRVYSEILDTAKAVLLIFSVLAICKYTGLYAWWIQFVGNI